MTPERLQKIIAESGFCSRRKAEELILAGRVSLNGAIVTTLGIKATLDDAISVDGKPILKERKVYYLFYKPLGTVTTVSDDRGRPTVVDFFKNLPERVFPVGRLDFNTTGALVMTNDGDLANLMMHPSSNLQKTYIAHIDSDFKPDDRLKLERGILLEDGLTAPAQVSYTDPREISVIIHEGKKREVRRMFEALGYRVISLHRSRIAFLDLANLKPGSYRSLSDDEVIRIKTLCHQGKLQGRPPLR